jgi:hypothetical protein
MPESTLPVEHLFTLTIAQGRTSVLRGGPAGDRAIAAIGGGTFEGPKLRGIVFDTGGDWVTMRSDGSVKLDVRATLRTDDGALIYMTYNGIGVPQPGGALQLRTAPLFETGAEAYAWLNNVQAIATGTSDRGQVVYEVYALK